MSETPEALGRAIYALRDGQSLTPMHERAFATEALLQHLVAEYPELLGGGESGAAHGDRWMLVTREAGIPASEGGSSQWYLDHLLRDE